MLSRVFTPKPRRKERDEENSNNSSMSGSILSESEDILVGFSEELPLVSCGHQNKETQLSSRQILRASVCVIGESRLGLTEKVVLLEGKVYAVKRFRIVNIRRKEFGKGIERLSHVSGKCEYLVPVTAYLYSKRIKLVVSDYYPMGSLADLLAERGHTALDWNQRLRITLTMARAIACIHTQSPPQHKNMKMNTHGNLTTSNVLINIDFTARLSDYGYTQLAESEEVSDSCQKNPRPSPRNYYCNKLCQKSDIYNFGVILLDMLGGSAAPFLINYNSERKEKIREGEIGFFEFSVEGNERMQALEVLDISLLCTNNKPESRPSIEHILQVLDGIK